MNIWLAGGAALHKRDYTLSVDNSFSLSAFGETQEKNCFRC
ncbi:MAG: hypothetical protein WBA13_08010 [Microcoleaceae cyanobacterium]